MAPEPRPVSITDPFVSKIFWSELIFEIFEIKFLEIGRNSLTKKRRKKKKEHLRCFRDYKSAQEITYMWTCCLRMTCNVASFVPVWTLLLARNKKIFVFYEAAWPLCVSGRVLTDLNPNTAKSEISTPRSTLSFGECCPPPLPPPSPPKKKDNFFFLRILIKIGHFQG